MTTVFGVQFSQSWQQALLLIWLLAMLACVVALLQAGRRLARARGEAGCYQTPAIGAAVAQVRTVFTLAGLVTIAGVLLPVGVAAT